MSNGADDLSRNEKFDFERRAEFLSVLKVACHRMSMPLNLGFWLADLIYVPQFKWQFLFLRCSIIPANLLILKMRAKVVTTKQAEFLAFALTLYNAAVITLMVFIIGDINGLYYAGLNLVGLGSITFFPWYRKQLYNVLAIVYLPFVAYGLFECFRDTKNIRIFLVESFFMFGTVAISLVIRMFNHGLKVKEFAHRLELAKELGRREEMVRIKTQESVQLRSLSRQFSPQIVHAIASGAMNLNAEVHRSNICAIFIDIVNSTQRITRIDQDSIRQVVSQFMDDTMRTLIKYDLTIDKFLGDGILAFANDPMPHPDYVERTVYAAFDILSRLQQKSSFYEELWLQEFQVRIGIASGFANVGFFGKTEVFRTYTAIGPVMNLAARLCSEAAPNSVVVSNEIKKILEQTELFEIVPLGNLKLKGFEEDLIKGFSIRERSTSAKAMSSGSSEECPTCNKIMHLDVDVKGIYVFKCRDCESNLENTKLTEAA